MSFGVKQSDSHDIFGWNAAVASFEILTVDANIDPPNHTAYLCMWWVMTCTSIGLGWGKNRRSFVTGRCEQSIFILEIRWICIKDQNSCWFLWKKKCCQEKVKLKSTFLCSPPRGGSVFCYWFKSWKWTPALTLSLPPLSSSLIFSLASTVLFRSLCRRRPKSRNMVEPPDRTMFCRRGKKTIAS